MEYTPRYSQPFTFLEALSLDVSVITEEISRLQNSLQHLRQTQEVLREYVASEAPADADPEVTKALEENDVVIGSQEERISMLKMVLVEKGIHTSSGHYDVQPLVSTTTQTAPPQSTETTAQTADGQSNEPGDGIYL